MSPLFLHRACLLTLAVTAAALAASGGCSVGTTPDCTDAAAGCAPDLDGTAGDARRDVGPDATPADAPIDAIDEIDANDAPVDSPADGPDGDAPSDVLLGIDVDGGLLDAEGG